MSTEDESVLPATSESKSAESNLESNVEIVFQVEDIVGEVDEIKENFELSDSVAVLKDYLSKKCSCGPEMISISYNDETLSNVTTIEDLGVEVGASIDLQVKVPSLLKDSLQEEQLIASSSPPSLKETTPPPNEDGDDEEKKEIKLSTAITVQVKTGEEIKDVLVAIDGPVLKKPFIGGYHDKSSGKEFHHASAQTLPKFRPDDGIARFQRDTQTFKLRNHYQQVSMDAATQMNQTGCYISDKTDKIIVPKQYETADVYHSKILKKVIVLQSYWRRWLAKKYVDGLRKEKHQRMIWEEEERIKKQKEKEARKKKEFERRMNPRTKEDFDLLYHALEMWRLDELERINATTSGPERKAALCMLLEQEAALIASIGRHKVVADEENEEKKIRQFLEATASSRKWIAFDGEETQMDTQYTLRANHLKDLYETVTMESLAKDERLDILLTLKATVREHDCKLTREIVELVDREADLLVRDTKPSALQGLRKRISTLFLQYCKTPLFNPEAAKHIKVPQDPMILRTNIYYCRSCCQYLPSTDFELSTNSRVVGHCRQCQELDNKARAREDYTLYRAMLKSIRRTEENYQDNSHIIFLIQEVDLRYLIENIWAGQSAMSAEKDLFDLILVRWNVKEHWSPWNCVLLTKDEARAHVKLDNPEKAYSCQFVEKIKHRHVLAKNYFTKIPGMMDGLKTKVTTLPLPRPKERVMLLKENKTDSATPMTVTN